MTIRPGAGHRRPWRRGQRVALLVAALLAVAGLVMLGSGWAHLSALAGAATEGTSMNGKAVVLDPGTAAGPAAAPQASGTGAAAPPAAPAGAAPSAADTELSVPAVGLDVPLERMREVDGQVTPPGFRAAYRIDNLGVPVAQASRGTVYVAMHSLRGGAVGPGNYLTNVRLGTATVPAGALAEVDGVDYRITGWEKVTKDRLPYDTSVWAAPPGTLVLITCLERPGGGPSLQNIIITGTLDTAGR